MAFVLWDSALLSADVGVDGAHTCMKPRSMAQGDAFMGVSADQQEERHALDSTTGATFASGAKKARLTQTFLYNSERLVVRRVTEARLRAAGRSLDACRAAPIAPW